MSEISPSEPHAVVRRFVSIAIVATTVLTAVVGYFASTASRAGDQSSARSERLAVRALAEAVRAREQANRTYEQLVVAEEQSRRGANALQQALFADDRRLEPLRAQQLDWERVAGRVRQLTPVPERAAMVEDLDIRYRFFAEQRYESLRLAGLRDAANDESAAWGAQGASYTAVLTLLAVALYLLGFSLSQPQGPRLVFVVVGVGLSLVSLGWAAATRASSPSRAPDEAAADYARGVVRLESASTPADYRAAERAFSGAIRERPDHAWAYKDRATAIFAASSPDSAGAEILTSRAALRRATADVRKALALGLENYAVLADLGLDEIALALQSRDDDERNRLLDAAIEHLRHSIRLSPQTFRPRYDLALGLLARGRIADARAAYQEAIEHTFYVPGSRTRRDSDLQEEDVAEALTGLALLEASRPELRPEITATKELIVGSVARGRIEAAPVHRALTQIRLDVFPSDIQASRISPRELDPDRSRVSAQWWTEGRATLGWSVLADASGPVAGANADVVGLTADAAVPGTYYFLTDALRGGTGHCLQTGEYRLELYANGRLVATKAARVAISKSKLMVVPGLDLLVCAPPDWKLLRRGLSGLLSGVTSPDGRRGAYLFRVALPLSFRNLEPAQQVRKVLDLLIADFSGLFPSPPTFEGPISEDYFLDLDGVTRLTYSYRGGEIDAKAGVTDDGTVIAAVLFGPPAFFDGGDWQLIYDSLTRND